MNKNFTKRQNGHKDANFWSVNLSKSQYYSYGLFSQFKEKTTGIHQMNRLFQSVTHIQ